MPRCVQYRPEFLFLGAWLRVGRLHLLQKFCQTFKVSWVGIDIENDAIAVDELVGGKVCHAVADSPCGMCRLKEDVFPEW